MEERKEMQQESKEIGEENGKEVTGENLRRKELKEIPTP